MKCPKCSGFVFSEMEYYENGERVLDTHCLHCGTRYYPPGEKGEVRQKGRNPDRRKDAYIFPNKDHWKEGLRDT